MLGVLKNKFLNPLQEFIHDSRSIGIVLLACTFLSLILSNIPSIQNSYHHFWEANFDGTTHHQIHIGFLNLPNSALIIINDFLMAFFFFLAGMEIKREMVNGELSSLKKSILPAFSAIGGMLIPAVLFALINYKTAFQKGWAIPTATDIAFTLGVASLLGKRVPVALKVFITALAIIDDLGAICVIAIFYGGTIKLIYLMAAALVTAALYFAGKQPKKFGFLQIILGILLWYCMFNSGIHATVAGVVLAFTVPVKNLSKLELQLHPPVYFLILPLFALANTSISIAVNELSNLHSTLSWGIIIGLVIGKPAGICTAAYILIKLKFANLPNNTNWPQLIGAGILSGIGFTMSIFIATLAFTTPELQNISKISILIASITAIVMGILWLQLPVCKQETTLVNNDLSSDDLVEEVN